MPAGKPQPNTKKPAAFPNAMRPQPGQKKPASLPNARKPQPSLQPLGTKAGSDLFQPVPIRKKQPLTLGQRWADRITRWAGSWTFISLFMLVLFVWIGVNVYLIIRVSEEAAFDPYPFILLNLFLSCVAAIQAPVILMSQNRDVERDRRRAELDYYVNRRAEREIKVLQKEILEIKEMISKSPKEKEIQRIESEILHIQRDLEQSIHHNDFEQEKAVFLPAKAQEKK